jgi:hypothetical protein
MPEQKPEKELEITSYTLVMSAANFSPLEQSGEPRPYSSMSYTVGAVIEPADSEPQGAPSKPLNPNAAKALTSVLQTRGSQTVILRDDSGEL